MENRHVCIVIFYICLCIFFWIGILWNQFVTQNVLINIFLPTHPPKRSDWRFAWQNGYGRHPLGFKKKYFNLSSRIISLISLIIPLIISITFIMSLFRIIILSFSYTLLLIVFILSPLILSISRLAASRRRFLQ